MVSVEQRGREWVVIDGNHVASIHPTRSEAERTALWLALTASEISSRLTVSFAP